MDKHCLLLLIHAAQNQETVFAVLHQVMLLSNLTEAHKQLLLQGQVSTERLVTPCSRRPSGSILHLTVILSATTTYQRISHASSLLTMFEWSVNGLPAIQIITSCNSTREELCKEFGQSTQDSLAAAASSCEMQQGEIPPTQPLMFQYVDHVRTYPKFKFAGVEGTKVCTVAFRRFQ